jgi:hypothetical protein
MGTLERDADAWYEMLTSYWREFPGLKVVPYEDNWFFRTLMKMGWSMGATTIWNTVWMKSEYIETLHGVELMKHEIQHVKDQHKWHILFFLTYWILPIGPSFKAFWEWRAYQCTLATVWHKYKKDSGYGRYIIDFTKSNVAQQFTGKNYAWMLPWPWFVNRMIERFIKSLP